VLELIGAEYRLRRGREPGLDVEEYRQRLPRHADRIDEALGPAATWLDGGAGPVPALPRRVGRYEIERPIARGGMAEVWRGRDLDLGRSLAIKVLQERFAGQPELRRRFHEEARITGQLEHPGIPPVHEVGVLPDSRPFLAMKLIHGRTLAELLAERASVADDLPRWLGIFEQVSQAVGYAHSQGVIHRDLKPSNIMVGPFGEVQVMDWGLAKVLGERRGVSLRRLSKGWDDNGKR
jgi:serine/threonine-protein kinase